ncbi:MAG TPA: PVC-type heme-binding CxxCH protein [Pirellulales bacterium]
MSGRSSRVVLLCGVILALSVSRLAAHQDGAAGPLAPALSREKFRLADDNLTIELVSAEPDVNSPVAMTWDAAGRMYVVEMSDYPTAESGGKIKRLTDADGDGRYEAVSVFAEGLKFPSGALPWNGGLLVTCAPDILFLKDTDGDGRADERRVILTGFVEGNQQLRVNGLYWGIDNWIYGANGRSGGDVRRPTDPPDKAVSIRRHDFRFRPETGEFVALAGFSQFGLGRDDFNHRFLSWNTIPFRHAVIEEQDLNRNPHMTGGVSIALVADASDTGRVYPISAPPKTFNRERTDYFNASCGSMVFRGAGLGNDYQGNAFVCEPLTNLVHRKTLKPNGATFVARRGEENKEFLASADSWCHPVNLAMGPDGSLYVADFYREWVEHPQFVQEALRKDVDFRTGSQHGRIWRIRRKDFSPPPANSFDLTKLSTAELVEQLNTDNAWLRDTAQQLLVERQAADAAPLLEKLVREGKIPATRAQALWTLVGLNALRPEVVGPALQDKSAAVREQAIDVYRRGGPALASLAGEVMRRVRDKDPRVRFSVALAAGDLDTNETLSTLAEIAVRDVEDEWTRLAVLSGIGRKASPFLNHLVNEHPEYLNAKQPAQLSLLRDVAAVIGARQDEDEIAGLCRLIALAFRESGPGSLAALSGLADGMSRRSKSLEALLEQPTPAIEPHLPEIRRLLISAKMTAVNQRAAKSERLLALRLLVQTQRSMARELIPMMFSAEEPPAMIAAAAAGLADLDDLELTRRLLERWGTLTIGERRELISALLRRASLAAMLLDLVEKGVISPKEFDITAREGFARLPSKELKERAAKLLASPENSDRDAVVAANQAALALAGSAEKGAILFANECLTCHQIKYRGARVGPDLSGVASRPKGALLVDILNPSKEISPDFVNYVMITKSGQVLTGLLAADTAAAVRLRRAGGAEETILRSEIEELRPENRSIMPDGFEEKFKPQDLANLLEFLQRPAPLPPPEAR